MLQVTVATHEMAIANGLGVRHQDALATTAGAVR
jgi:hypothetical protein